MKQQELYRKFEGIHRELGDLRGAIETLTWDQETVMPAKAAPLRARQLSTLAALYHERLTAPEYGGLVEKLEALSWDAWERANLREARRDYDKAIRLPRSLVRELAETASLSYQAWIEARRRSDFGAFVPWLEKMFELKRHQAACLCQGSSLYDTLLDEYEPGARSAVLDPLFAQLRPRLTDLTERITHSSCQPNQALLQGHFDPAAQERFGRRVITAMGFDSKAGRLDVSPHPFCSGLTPCDVRITTRYSASNLLMSFFGMIHETGHALYEQGLDANHFGAPANQAISLGIHESQSRLWEIYLAHGRSFWEYWYPLLQDTFVEQFASVKLESFLHAINQVRPSLIRVDADEVTYGLHVIMRYELEKALLDGDLAPADLEEVWNRKMLDYLGIEPQEASQGVLQDVHWSHGLVGYFPTYLLGTLYAAQFYHQACLDLPNLSDQVRQGQLLELRRWLGRKIHQVGRTRTADELVIDVTGTPLKTYFFLNHLEEKYRELYQL